MPRHLLFLLFVALAAPACDGGQVGEETLTCAVIDRAPVGQTESVLDGVVPAELIDDLTGSFAGEIQWADGTSAQTDVELSYLGGPIELVQHRWVGDGDVYEVAPDCGDALAIDMRLEVASADGRLAESWIESVFTRDDGESGVRFEVVDGFAGSLDVEAFVPPGDWMPARGVVDGVLAPSILELTISGQVASAGSDDQGTVSARTFAIGELSAQRP